MGAIKKYFKKEFQKNMLFLGHDNLSDFYLGSCQRNKSALPLLCIRTFVYVGCVGILLASTIMTGNAMSFVFWPIFLTHWGLVFITVTSGFATFVSLRVYFSDPIDETISLPWYIQTYWFLYNSTVPISFFISAFYWILLTATGIVFSALTVIILVTMWSEMVKHAKPKLYMALKDSCRNTSIDDEFAINPVLDVFIHAVNSILMLILLLFSRHPSRLLHVVYPLATALTYLIFSIIYYYSGGTNPFGEVYIYPMLDWSNPGEATGTAFMAAFTLIFMHLIVVGISLGRDKFTNRYCVSPNSLNILNEAYN